MKTAILIPIMTVALAAGALVFFRAERSAPESRPAKSGPDLREGRKPKDEAGLAADRPARLAKIASADPDAAEREAMGLEGNARDEALEMLVAEFAGDDPARALRLAAAIEDPVKRGNSLGFALAQQAAADAEGVFQWLADTSEEEPVKAAAERMALPALAEVDAVRVAKWISEGKATPQATEAAVVTTVQRWVQKDAGAAAQWVAAFEDERLLHEAMDPLVSLWTKQDAKAPAAWIEKLPAGMAKDEACAAYAAALALTKPDEAIEWAGKIEGKDLVAETMKRIEAAR